MTLRLKDREQQAWLDKMTRSMFAEARNAFMEDAEQIKFDINDKAILTIKRDEVENVGEYDPDFWNVYPEVKPPEGVLMRVETGGGRKFCGYYHTFAEGGCWCYEDGTVCPEAISKSVKRYRTWE